MTWSNTVVEMAMDGIMSSLTVIRGIVVMFGHTRSTDIFLFWRVVVGARVFVKVYMASIYIVTTTWIIRESSIYNRECCVRFIDNRCLESASIEDECQLARVQSNICGYECSESLHK